MYVSLDMQNMRIVHKHSSVNAVCGLVHIELPDVAVHVCPIDMTVKHKTDMEIKILFRSCFPGQADHMPVAEMKSKILQFAEEFPVTDLDELEVKRQADSIRDGDKKAYKYVKGSFRASRPAELFADATGDAVPAWSEKELIQQFYENCPEGHEVDHVIPLQGKTASGLHVLSNLQYLPMMENRTKGNKVTT